MSAWKLLADEMPEVGQVVLLLWPVPDMAPIVRLGSIMFKPILSDPPIWKFDLDYGDAGAWVYTNRNDEQPTHWMPIPDVPACPGHIASDDDAKVCRYCGTHIDEERP